MNKDKNIVISGGSKGIGRATVDLFLEKGFRVFTSARDVHAMSDINPDRLKVFKADLSDREQIKQFAYWVKEQSDTIDILVNNVGIFLPGTISTEEEGVFEQQINTNLASTYHLTRDILDALRKSDNAYIFNICSTASIVAYRNGGSYCISKFAQLGLTKVLREELKPEKIRVSAILPGPTYTASWQESKLSEKRFMPTTSIAQLIYAAYKMPKNVVTEEIVVRPMDGDI